MPRVLIIVPAYNESATIADVLQSLKDHAPECDVVVIDDGSTDHTSEIVARFPAVQLVRLPINLGIGGAMQTGYKYAIRHGYDIAVQCDADGQHPASEIPRLVSFVQEGKADIVIGSRYVAESQYRPSFGRRVGKSLLSRLVDAVVGGGLTDTTSGFRAMNRAVLSVFAQTYPDDYPEAEALVILHKSGLKAAEVPVEMSPRLGGATSITPHRAVYYMIKVALAIFIDIFRTFTRASGDARP
ncbi:MAG TPA: glycosyltransferase family 2 protein [Candidatus Hydrogenedentes bacterium]|nr:glycosyltransferase family 2 protein [Candidatus Hydrogenedentota bacterium]HOS01991.1 glycosyltransferase family 2 protein [Candidatus Hydrogenedentota bacterium]